MNLNNQVLRINARALVEDSRTTMYNGTSYQTISGDQGVVISYRTTDFTLKSFQGVLDSVRVDLDEMNTAIDIPKGLDNIQFTNAALTILLNNSIDAPVKLNIDVTGTNSGNGRSATLPVRVERLMLGQNQIVVQDTVGLIGVFPDNINISGWVGLGEAFFGDQSIISVSQEQGVSGSFQLDAGLQMIIGATHLESELIELEKMDYPLEGVEINLNISNTVPISGKVRILLGNDSTAMDTIIGVDLPAIDFDNHLHRAIRPATGSFVVNLGSEQLDILRPVDDDVPIYTRQFIAFDGTNGEAIWLYANDSLTVQASGTVFYTIDIAGGDEDE